MERTAMSGVLAIRRASEHDSEDLFIWRNDAETRQNSKNTAPVLLEDHLSWFAASLTGSDRLIYIGSIGDKKIGTVRFDRSNKSEGCYAVSITVNPAFRGGGYGKELLSVACSQIAPCTLEAEIKDENEASKRLFAACGFRYVGPAADTGLGLYRAELSN
jgi:RimJ/RimL family protein N-acetyltransferase